MSEKNGIPNKPIISYSEKIGVRIHLDFTRPSPIQTVLSALDSHQILPIKARGLRITSSPPVENSTLPRRTNYFNINISASIALFK